MLFCKHFFLWRPLKGDFCEIINSSKALIEITNALDTYTEPMTLKTKYTNSVKLSIPSH